MQALLSGSMPPPPSVPLHEMQAKKPHQVSKGAQQFDKNSNDEWLNRPNMSFGSCWNEYYKQSKSFREKQKQENKRQEMYTHNQAMVHVEHFSSKLCVFNSCSSATCVFCQKSFCSLPLHHQQVAKIIDQKSYASFFLFTLRIF